MDVCQVETFLGAVDALDAVEPGTASDRRPEARDTHGGDAVFEGIVEDVAVRRVLRIVNEQREAHRVGADPSHGAEDGRRHKAGDRRCQPGVPEPIDTAAAFERRQACDLEHVELADAERTMAKGLGEEQRHNVRVVGALVAGKGKRRVDRDQGSAVVVGAQAAS